MNGALTYLLIYILKKYPGLTYGDLLDLMHEELRKFNEGGCLPAKFLRKIFKDLLSQVSFFFESFIKETTTKIIV